MQRRLNKNRTSASGAERRTELRRPAHGKVVLIFFEPKQLKVAGEIVDKSVRGYRVAHAYAALSPGRKAQLKVGTKVMDVQVMWTRITGDRAECGLLIV